MRIDGFMPSGMPAPARAALPGATASASGFAGLVNTRPAAAPPQALPVRADTQHRLPERGRTGDREARRHGRAMLQALAALQLSVLGGGVADDAEPGPLQRLADLAASLPKADDPGLEGVLADIALRAAVELARREMRGIGGQGRAA